MMKRSTLILFTLLLILLTNFSAKATWDNPNLKNIAGDQCVTLSWDAYDSPDVIGYNVKRTKNINTPGASYQYDQINEELLTESTYFDEGLLNCVRYGYYIEAVFKDNSKLNSFITDAVPFKEGEIYHFKGDTYLSYQFKKGSTYVIEEDFNLKGYARLYIEAGVVVKFKEGTKLSSETPYNIFMSFIKSYEPIVFTSYKDDEHGGDTNGDGDLTQPQAGNWNTLEVPLWNMNGMPYCKVLYANTGYTFPEVGDNELSHWVFQDCINAIAFASNTIENTQFSENDIINCTNFINGEPGTNFSAANNWFGDASGPNASTNPEGKGCAIADGISFEPYSNEPYLHPYVQNPIANKEFKEDAGEVMNIDLNTIFARSISFDYQLGYAVEIDGEAISAKIEGNTLTIKTLENKNGTNTIHLKANTKYSTSYDKPYFANLSFNVNITPVNDAPTVIHLSTNTIVENADAGIEIGALTAMDVDIDQTFTYTIAENENFEIVGDKLVSKVAFDFEKKDSYVIDIKVEDQDGLSFTQDFIIFIDNVFEIFPEQTEHDFIESEAKGAELFELTVDGENSEFQFEIVKSNWSPAPWEIVNNKLVSKYSINAETLPTSPWIVTIQASNNKGILLTKDYSVQVIDIPEAPVFYTMNYNLYFEENKTIGSEVGVVKTSNDRGDIVSFLIDDNDFFEIQPGESSADGRFHEAIIISKGVFDFEKKSSYNLEVTATDQLGLFTKQIHTINIKDVNEAPSAIQLSNATILENSAIGSEVGTLTATDIDADQTFIYTIADNTNFKIVGDQLMSNSEFDFETQDSYSIEITVTDQGDLSYTESFNIYITDINEAPTAIHLSNATILENSAIGSEVGILTATDEDADQTLTFTMAENELFELTGDKLVSKAVFDFETLYNYSVEITVADQAGLTYSASFTIQIQDENEAPTEIQLSNALIAENSAIATEVGTLTASDVDVDQTFTYSISDNENFEISGDKLISSSDLDFETQDSYSIEITVTDQNDLTYSESLTIEITDVNEAPTAIELSNASIAENSAIGSEVGILTATDEDADQTLTFTMAENELFELVGDKLVNKSEFNYEANNSYSVEITVADQDGLNYSDSFTIQIEDANEAPTAIHLSNATILENSAIGSEVGTLTATDIDADQTFIYTIADNTNFKIVGDQLMSNSEFDFETQDTYSVEITVTDQGDLSYSESFSIEVTDANDAPTAILLSNSTIAENTAIGTEVGVLTASDVDADQTLTFTMAENELFELTGDKLVSKSAFDYEANNSYPVEITVSDQVGLTYKQSFSIDITDVNEAPTAIQLSNATIVENSAIGTEVGTLTASDVDANQTFIYMIAENDNFEIAGDKLVSKAEFDYEADNSYSIEITVTDQSDLTYSESLTIEITDVNEAPTAISLSNATIAENSAIGTEVGILTASDVDADQTLTFTMAENEFFELAGDKLVSKAEFDYEADNSYSIEITVTDQGGLTYSDSFTIQIEDANEAPTAIHLSNATILENSAIGSEVGTLTATDEDASQTLTFTMAENEFFELVGDKFVNKSEFNYEANNSYSVEITVADQDGLNYSESFAIQIEDANEAPTAIQLSSISIAENSAIGTEVGILTASDVDADQTFIYTIAENENFKISGDKLISSSDLDFETQDSYSVEITVTDQGDLSYSESFSIEVTDANDAPTEIQLSNATIAENSAIGTEIGILTAIDEDASQTLTFTMAENELFALAVDKLVSKAEFDYEADNSYSIEITVTDQGGLTYSDSFTIQIEDANEAPTAIHLSNATILENSAIGSEVGTLTATDIDADQTFTYSISDNENFEIVGDKLVNKSELDFEAQNSYSVEITVFDQDGLSHKQSFNIQIYDANEAPTAIQLSNVSIAENSAIGSEVGTLTASDVDASQTLTFTISENEFFELVGDKLVSKSEFDYELTNSYSVEITVADQGGLTYKQSFSIDITDENEAPIAIQLSKASILENAIIGTEIGTLTASDIDLSQIFTFSMDESEYFELNGDKIVSKEIFDYEDHISYLLQVTVTDQDGLSYTQNFTIQIENRNEAPRFISDPFVDAQLGEKYTYDVVYQDVDTEGCVLTALEMPSWLIFEDNGDGTATLSGIPSEAGAFKVILEAWDNEYLARQEFEIIVETVTGIEDVEMTPIVQIYPNPTIRELHICLSNFKNDKATVSLFSTSGSLIFKKEHKNVGGEVKIIKSVQQLRSGVYLLVIESKGYRKSYKIVKQ